MDDTKQTHGLDVRTILTWFVTRITLNKAPQQQADEWKHGLTRDPALLKHFNKPAVGAVISGVWLGLLRYYLAWTSAVLHVLVTKCQQASISHPASGRITFQSLFSLWCWLVLFGRNNLASTSTSMSGEAEIPHRVPIAGGICEAKWTLRSVFRHSPDIALLIC